METEFKSYGLTSDQILKSAKAGGKTEVVPPFDLFRICETAERALVKELIAEEAV